MPAHLMPAEALLEERPESPAGGAPVMRREAFTRNSMKCCKCCRVSMSRVWVGQKCGVTLWLGQSI